MCLCQLALLGMALVEQWLDLQSLHQDMAAADEEEWQEMARGCWPFQRLSDQLLVDCLCPTWEVRHGAALALRELLSFQAGSAAVVAPVQPTPSGRS